MGTRSRFDNRFRNVLKPEDVVTTIAQGANGNRATRRAAYSKLRRHDRLTRPEGRYRVNFQ